MFFFFIMYMEYIMRRCEDMNLSVRVTKTEYCDKRSSVNFEDVVEFFIIILGKLSPGE